MRRPAPALGSDAAIALGIASTALPFARTDDAILERWLRILRLYGDAANALQALGVGEDRPDVTYTGGEVPRDEASGGEVPGGAVPGNEASGGEVPGGEVPSGELPGGEVPGGEIPSVGLGHGGGEASSVSGAVGVEQVSETASIIAGELGDETIDTRHLLLALMRLHGAAFDRVLEAHGAYRSELIEKLGLSVAFCQA